MKHSFFAILVSVLPLAVAHAADLPYAADTLPYTAGNADLIINASGATKLEEVTPSIAIYQIQVSQVVKGASPEGNLLKAVVPKTLDVEKAESFVNSVVFLKGPLSGARKQQYGLANEATLYEVVSGRYGVVAAETPSLREEIARYIKTGPKEHVEWAARNVESSHLYLQRSAVFEAKRQAKNPAMIAVLEKALTSENVAIPAKKDAIHALQSSGAPNAALTLRDAAKNAGAAISVRKMAVEALGSLKEGQQILQEFKASGDAILAPTADEVLKDKSGHTENSGTIRVEGDLNAKLLNVSSLSKTNTAEAADQLKTVATDVKEDLLVRKNAIIGLSQFESGIGQTALRGIAEKVSEPALKKLADSLVDK